MLPMADIITANEIAGWAKIKLATLPTRVRSENDLPADRGLLDFTGHPTLFEG